MEELRSRMARKAPDGEARPAFGGGLRLASLVTARIEEYAEIFDGFAASCTIPVLELPPAIDGYGEAVGGYRSSGLDYSEIFEALDAGNLALSYEELVYRVNGLKEEEEEQDSSRVQEEAGFGQQETRASDLFAEEPNEGRTIFSELNQSILSSPLNCVTQPLNFSCGPTCQQRRVNELDCLICISQAHDNFQPDFEAEIVSSIRFAENCIPKNILSDDYRLTGDLKEEMAGKHGEVLDQCFVSSIANGFENNLEVNKRSCKYPPSDGASENLKRYSRSSIYHSTLSGDIPFPDYTFVTISEINLHTRPLQVPPPLRPPPKLDVKQGMTKSMAPQASNTVIDSGTLPKTPKSYQAHHFGGPRTHHALKETLKSNSPVYFNVVDASRAAAASAAAMVEAMDQAQARLKSAKESRERMRGSLQCGQRFGSNVPWTQNGLNIDFSGGTRHKTKGAQKVVPNHEEKVTTLFFAEEAEEAMHGKESGLYQLPQELEERSHEWKMEKQFYELVSIEKKFKLLQELPLREWDEKLMTSRVIDDENHNCIEEIKLEHQLNTYQSFSEKECCGNNGREFTCSNDDEVDGNKGECFEKSLNESILFSRGELHVQDGSAKVIKSGIMVDSEEIIDILETYPMPYLLVEDEFKQKEGCILQIPKEGKTKLEDIVNVIRNGRNENELKKHHESHICSEDKRTANFGTEAYVCEDNLEKLAQLHGGKIVGEKLVQDKDSHGYTVSESCVVVESDSSKADDRMQHAGKVNNSYGISLFSMEERLKEDNMASLHNASTVEVDLEYRASFSCDQEENVEAIREECQLVKLQKTKRHTYGVSYNVGNDTELEGIDIASKQESRSFSEIYETCEPEENVKKGIHYQMAKLDLPNRNELKSSKVAVQQDCLVEVKKASEHWLKGEKQKMYELPGKSENHENRLNSGDEEIKGDIFIAKVQAALELEKKIMGLSSGQQVFHRIRVKDREAVQQPTSLDSKGTILSPYIDASRSSLLPPMENISDEWIDTEDKMKEILDRERKQAVVLQRKLAEKERVREREKYRTGVEKATRQACERAFSDVWERAEKIALERVVTEARHRPLAECRDIADKSSSEALEKSKKATNEAKMRAERAAVEGATAEVREGAIARTLVEQASLEARRQTEASTNFSKERSWKYNEADGIFRPAEQENSGNNLKPTDVHDAPNDAKLQSAGGEGQSPLRCKARQERHQRIIDRVAKALAEKNMRDILAQREESERNRLADSLDVEVKRWSNGKEGNLRALLSTLQYILGPDSGWHPIPLTDVLTAAAVKKAYRKATLYVHPDKLQQRGAGIHHKYICEKVFDLLKDAWNKFNSEVR